MEFREFVAKIRQARGTAVVGEPLNCNEIPHRVTQAERGGNRALLVDQVIDSRAKVVGNLFGSASRICQAFSVRGYSQLFKRLDKAINNPVPVKFGACEPGDFTVTRSPDLKRLLPTIKYSQDDAAPYLTSGIVVTRFPSSARRHACFVRMAVLGGNRLLFNPGTPRIKRIVDETVGRGEELEVRILIGAPAEMILMACVTMPNQEDKLEVAQSLAGEGLVFSEDALPFPLSTEYVMKARVVPQYEQEGPFGEIGGTYSVKARNPVCLVDELRVRRDPVFHSVSAGVAKEHLELLSLGPRSFLERIKREFPQIFRYELPVFGADRLAVLVVKERIDTEKLKARLWDVPLVRGFIIVNQDVASGSARDLLWAMLQRAPNSDHFRFTTERHPLYNTDRFVVDASVSNLSAFENKRVNVYRMAN